MNDENSAPKEDSVNGILSIEENSLGEISLNTKDQPSHELITQLNRLGQLPKQCDDVAVQVNMYTYVYTVCMCMCMCMCICVYIYIYKCKLLIVTFLPR